MGEILSPRHLVHPTNFPPLHSGPLEANGGKTMSTPEICPKCGKPLDHVDYYEYSQWKFNPDTGAYDNNSLYGGTAEVKCPHCENDLGELFPEGPANK